MQTKSREGRGLPRTGKRYFVILGICSLSTIRSPLIWLISFHKRLNQESQSRCEVYILNSFSMIV